VFDAAHAREHSLEVHLPFLQAVLGELTLVPLVVGDAAPGQVAQVLERLWGGPETLIVVSSDLSHYHDYATARRLDAATSQAIEQMRFEDIGYDDACGRIPVSGLLHYARHHGFRVQTIDLRNSGDTAGGRDRVVGYGAYAVQ
jgi:AmmeMemoRadiSam system protein B